MTEINLWCLHTPESSVSTFNIFFLLNEQFEKQRGALTGRWKYIIFYLSWDRETLVFLVASHWKCDESALKDASVNVAFVSFLSCLMLTRCSTWIKDPLVAPRDQMNTNGGEKAPGTLLIGGSQGLSDNLSFVGVSQITNQN